MQITKNAAGELPVIFLNQSDRGREKESAERKKKPQKILRLIAPMGAVVVVLAILIWRNQDAILAFFDFIGDRQAVSAYLDEIGIFGQLMLVGLIGIQVLIPVLPAEPAMIAGGYAYGFLSSFLIIWSVTVAVSQAVFLLARHAGRPLVERFVPADTLNKWTRIASERGMIFFMLAFVIPPVPSDTMVYVAGLSAIKPRRFLMANIFGRIPMVALYTLAGSYGFSLTPGFIVGLSAVGAVMLIGWWYFIAREQRHAVDTAM